MFMLLHINFVNMTIAHAIDYVAYCTITCNGTSNVAECVRLMTDRSSNGSLLKKFKEDFNENLYQFLCYMSTDHVAIGKAIGTCSENRYSPCSHKSMYDWDKRRLSLLQIIQKFFFSRKAIDTNQDSLDAACHGFVTELSKSDSYPSIGPLIAMQFLQVSSLVGLCPLGAASFAVANDSSLGPGSFIRICLSKNKLSNDEAEYHFYKLMDDINSIWDDGKISKAIVENTLCELSRSYWKTAEDVIKQSRSESIRSKAIKKWKVKHLPSPRIVMDITKRKESDAKDVFYEFKAAGGTQSFFKLIYSGEGSTKSKPSLFIMKHGNNEDSNVQCARITNWKKDKHDKKMIQWSSRGKSMSLKSTLTISKKLVDIITNS